jgi:hypothetical protein
MVHRGTSVTRSVACLAWPESVQFRRVPRFRINKSHVPALMWAAPQLTGKNLQLAGCVRREPTLFPHTSGPRTQEVATYECWVPGQGASRPKLNKRVGRAYYSYLSEGLGLLSTVYAVSTIGVNNPDLAVVCGGIKRRAVLWVAVKYELSVPATKAPTPSCTRVSKTHQST